MKTFTRRQTRRSGGAVVSSNGMSNCGPSASYEFEDEELLVEETVVITGTRRKNTDEQPIADALSPSPQQGQVPDGQHSGKKATPAKRKSLFKPVERIAASLPQDQGQTAGKEHQATEQGTDAYMFPPDSPEHNPNASTQHARKRNVRMPSPSAAKLEPEQQQPKDTCQDVGTISDQTAEQKTSSGRALKYPPDYKTSAVSTRANRWTAAAPNGDSPTPMQVDKQEPTISSPVASSPFAGAVAIQHQNLQTRPSFFRAPGCEISPSSPADSNSFKLSSISRRRGRRRSLDTASLVGSLQATPEKQAQEDVRQLPGPATSGSPVDRSTAKRQKRSHSLDTANNTIAANENSRQLNDKRTSNKVEAPATGTGLSQLLSQAFTGQKTAPSSTTGRRAVTMPPTDIARAAAATIHVGSAPCGNSASSNGNMLPDLARCATAPSVLESSPASTKPVTRPTRPPLLPKASRGLSRQNSASKSKGDIASSATASNSDSQQNKGRVRFNTEAATLSKVPDKTAGTAVFKDVSLPNPIRTSKPQSQDTASHDSSPNSSSPTTPSGVLRGRLGLPGLRAVSQGQQGLVAQQDGGVDIISFSQMQSIAEAQETGEALALQDEASYALDGLSPGCSLSSHRECLSQMAGMLATRRGRSALRAEGLAQRVISAACNLHAESDPALSVSAATVLVSLAMPDAHGSYLASQDALKLAGWLLQAQPFTQSSLTASNTSSSSGNDVLQCAIKLLLEGSLARHIVPLLGHAGTPLRSVLPVVALALGAATTTDASMVKYSELTKQNMRKVGLLAQVAETVTTRLAEVEQLATTFMTTHNQAAITNCHNTGPNFQGPEEAAEGIHQGNGDVVADDTPQSHPSSTTELLGCLTELRLLLQVLENATFTCPDNEQALLDMQVPLPTALTAQQPISRPYQRIHLPTNGPTFVDVLIRCVTTIAHLFITASHLKSLTCNSNDDSYMADDHGTSQQSYAQVNTACNHLLQVTLGLLMNLTHNHVEARQCLAVSGGYTTLLQLLSWCAGAKMTADTPTTTSASRQDIVRHVELLTVCLGLLINSISTDSTAQQQVRQLSIPCTTQPCIESTAQHSSSVLDRDGANLSAEQQQQQRCCTDVGSDGTPCFQAIPLLCAILTAVMTSSNTGTTSQSAEAASAVATADVILTGSPAQPSNDITRPKTFSRTRIQRLSGQSSAVGNGAAQTEFCGGQVTQQQLVNGNEGEGVQLEVAVTHTTTVVDTTTTQHMTSSATGNNTDTQAVDNKLERSTVTVTTVTQTGEETIIGAQLEGDAGRAASNGQQQSVARDMAVDKRPSGQQSQEASNDAGEASIVQVYASMLLGFLIQDCPAAQQQACQLLPGGNLAAVLASISHMLHFYVQAGAITDTSKEAVVQLLQRLAPLVADVLEPAGKTVEAANNA